MTGACGGEAVKGKIMIYQTMGDRIKLALEMRNMKQKELAKRVGMTEVTISRYVTGDREPKADAIIAICNALCVSSDWLLGLTRKETP
jgi:transcriptional regulator with XRE-family HTH domain